MYLRNKKWLNLIIGLVLTVLVLPVQVFAATHAPVTGISVAVSNSTKDSMSSGAITVTAKGSSGVFGYGASAKTTTITIYNTSTSSATIAFSWTATDVNKLEIDGTTVTAASGSFSKPLKGNSAESVVITITTAQNNTENKLVMNNFSVVEAQASSKITLVYDESLGSVTVDGTTVASGGEVEVGSDGTAFVATPKSGISFLGWIDNISRQRISSSASATIPITEDTTYHVAFGSAQTPAWFIKGSEWYDDLNKAIKKSSSGDTIIPAADGTLPAGDYTIPSGVTLLIPYNDDNTIVTTEPPVSSTGSYTKPTVYRTLTMASGAKITLNGKMSVAASLIASQTYGYNGLPNSATGQIKMNSGSSISVESGGVIYAIGFIYGDGSVEVKSGGTVYECFQLRDFRGGDATSTITGDKSDKRLFPMMQYYVQNVQVPMTLNAGAIEKGISSFNITLAGIKYSEIPFIGSSSMFNIASGYVVKDYDEATDRLIITAHGNLQVNNYEFTIKVSLTQSVTLQSADYILPINHNITLDIQSGNVTVNQDISLLPGAEIKVQEGATCTLGSGTEIIVYDADNWGYYIGEKYGTNEAGTEETNTWLKPLKYMAGGTIFNRRAVGLAGLADASIMINGTVDASQGQIYTTSYGQIYSTSNGVLNLGAAGKLDKVYQATQDSTEISYVEIPVVPALLQNADQTPEDATDALTYVDTKEGGAGTYTYYASTGRWDQPSHFYDETAPVVTPPTCVDVGYTTHTCAVCGVSYTDSEVEALMPDEGHLWENGECTRDNCDAKFSIYATNIAITDGLDLYFYVKDSDLIGDAEYTAVVTKKFADGREDVVLEIDDEKWESMTDNGLSLHRFAFSDISAKEMTDKITVTICYSDGTAASSELTETVQLYAIRALKNIGTSEELTDKSMYLRTALVDMLNYGTACQTQFKYNTENPANTHDDLVSYAKFATSENPSCTNSLDKGEHGKLAAVSVSAKNNLMFTFYFKDIDEGATAKVTYTDHHKETKTISSIAAEAVQYGEETWYRFDVTGISMVSGRSILSCTVTDSEGNTYTVTDSVEGYAARNSSLDVLMKLMMFVNSAARYLS